MSDTKHTPGPWKWSYMDDFGEAMGLIGGERMFHKVIEVHEGAIYSEYSTDPACLVVGNKYDASLIAAAPELLEALEGAYKELVYVWGTEYTESEEGVRNDALIAKAKGEDQ